MSKNPENSALHEQVADQYKVVAALARNIAMVHEDIESMLRENIAPNLLQIRGQRSAELMEILGEILNNMDAVDEGDKWMGPIFHRAHELWPPEQSQ